MQNWTHTLNYNYYWTTALAVGKAFRVGISMFYENRRQVSSSVPVYEAQFSYCKSGCLPIYCIYKCNSLQEKKNEIKEKNTYLILLINVLSGKNAELYIITWLELVLIDRRRWPLFINRFGSLLENVRRRMNVINVLILWGTVL